MFEINRKKAVKNTLLKNHGTHHGIKDLYIEGNELNIKNLNRITNKIKFISFRKSNKNRK